MKTKGFFAVILLGVSLCVTPVYAQSRGGSHSSGSRSSSSSSHSGGHSSSRSSVSSSSRSAGSSSRSSVGSSNRSGIGSSNRSAANSSNRRSMNATSRRSMSSSDNRASSYNRGSAPSRGTVAGRPGTPSSARHGVGPTRSNTPQAAVRANASRDARMGGNPNRGYRPNGGNPHHPGHMPPSARPMHPMFHHPIHHHMMHMRPLFWEPVIIHSWHWPGFWGYCNNYWYDYHVTDVVVVHQYVRDNYGTDLITYAISGDLMYALVNDPSGDTYLQVFDSNDRVLAEQKVNRRYCKMELDRENGGCWILKRNDKDPMLFLYDQGKLMIYEAE